MVVREKKMKEEDSMITFFWGKIKFSGEEPFWTPVRRTSCPGDFDYYDIPGSDQGVTERELLENGGEIVPPDPTWRLE